MKIKLLIWLIIAVAISTFSSCDDEDNSTPDITAQLTKISIATSDDLKYMVQLYGTNTPFVGYNKLYFTITDISENKNITNASVVLYPQMDMVTMKHSAPVEQPVLSTTYNELYESAIVFIMPSGDAGSWSVRVAFEVDGMKDTVWLAVPTVLLPDEAKMYSFVSAINQKKYFVSLIEPETPKVGINNFNITVHEKVSMMSFPAVNDLSVEITPEMPSMDHGSPNNIHPIFQENGHYNGKVNFTMTGWWRVNFVIKSGSDTLSENAYFDITF